MQENIMLLKYFTTAYKIDQVALKTSTIEQVKYVEKSLKWKKGKKNKKKRNRIIWR